MIEHSDMVRGLKKPGIDVLERLTPTKVNLLHMAVGISGEAGELIDAVKKVVIYNKPIDRDNIVEELGDLEFYMEGLRQELLITREETISHNIAKLGHRYQGHRYSDEQAIERRDKV